MMLATAIEAALAGQDVDAGVLEAAFGEIMDGEAEPVQIAGLLVALRAKGESVEEIAAAARAHAVPSRAAQSTKASTSRHPRRRP